MNLSFYNLPRFCLALIVVLCLYSVSLESYAYDLKDYYPLRVGDSRLYLSSGIEKGNTWYQLDRESVLKTKIIQGVETYIEGELSSNCWNQEFEARAWDHEGLKLYQAADCEDENYELMDPVIPVLIAPRELEVGKKKAWTAPFGDETLTIEMTLEAVEDIIVFSGTGFAHKFEDTLRTLWQSGPEKCRSWYAKDIGMVKEECTQIENDMVVNENSQLFAARLGDSLIGSPLRFWQGEVFSFYLSQITTSGCDMIMDSIVIALGSEAPEFWWIKFTLDLEVNPVAWKITDYGQGTSPVLDSQSVTNCPIPGLNFSQVPYKVNIDDLTLDPQLWMRVPFEDHIFKLGFEFSIEKLSWELYFIDLLE